MFRGANNLEQVRFMDTVVKASLPSHAEKFEEKLFGIFSSICVNKGSNTAKEINVFNRSNQCANWVPLVRKAFSEVLDLTLKMHIAPSVYYSEFPATESEFEENQMEAYDQNAVADTQSRVFLCVRPSIWAYRRASQNSVPEKVVAAQVLIDEDTTQLLFS
jgi:hypothetical protein